MKEIKEDQIRVRIQVLRGGQELQEPGGEGRGLKPVSWVQRAEEVQAVSGVKALCSWLRWMSSANLRKTFRTQARPSALSRWRTWRLRWERPHPTWPPTPQHPPPFLWRTCPKKFWIGWWLTWWSSCSSSIEPRSWLLRWKCWISSSGITRSTSRWSSGKSQGACSWSLAWMWRRWTQRSTSTSWSPYWASPVMRCQAMGQACPRLASWCSSSVWSCGVETRPLRRRSGEHSAGWGCMLGGSTVTLGSPGSCSPKCGCGRDTWNTSRCLTATCSLWVPVGSPGLCGDQQVASHGIYARGQPKGLEGLPTPVCRGCEGGGIGGLSQSSSQVDPFLCDWSGSSQPSQKRGPRLVGGTSV